MPFRNTSSKQMAVLALKAAALGVLLYLILRNLQFPVIIETLSKLPLAVFPLALAIQFGVQILQAWRWKCLSPDAAIPFRQYFAYTCLGNAMGVVSPAALLSDGLNGYLLGKRYSRIAASVFSILLGRILGVLALVAFVAATLPSHVWVLRTLPLDHPLGLAALAAGSAALAGTGIFLLRRHRERISAHLDGMLRIALNPFRMSGAFLLSCAIQFLSLFIGFLGYHFMQVPISLGNNLFFGSIIIVLGLIPMTIGQIGVREGLNIFFFTLLPGVRKEHILANAGYAYVLLITAALINLAAWRSLREEK